MIETDAKEANAEPTLPSSKPPFLRRVQIRGYKSIAFCDVTLEPLTLLVGRNGSGKSNFLDALGFLKDIFETNLLEAVRSRGGWKSMITRDSTSEEITIGIDADYNSPGNVYVFHKTAHYSITIKEGPFGVPYIAKEAFVYMNSQGQPKVKYTRIGRYYDQLRPELRYTWEVHNLDLRHAEGSSRQDLPYLATSGFPLFDHLANGFRYSGFYNFSPDLIREPQRPDPGSLLDAKGKHLATAIENLQEADAGALHRLKQYLTNIVYEVRQFEVIRSGERQLIQFHVRGSIPDKLQIFEAASMSDGTLRILAALVAAFQIHRPTGPYLVAIEEPETSLHPAAMHALVDALDEATLHTQILLTTHSAEMLDNPTIKPANVRVVQMIDGQTVIAPVDEASVEIVKKKLNTLGGLERENQLEPDTDDLERQRKLSLNGRSTNE